MIFVVLQKQAMDYYSVESVHLDVGMAKKRASMVGGKIAAMPGYLPRPDDPVLEENE